MRSAGMSVKSPVRCMQLMGLAVVLLLSACSSLPPLENRQPSLALPPDRSSGIAKEAAPLLEAHPGLSGFKTLMSGEEAFLSRLRTIGGASRSIDIQYYIWHDDLTGRALHEALLRAADRGVRVRLLLDDLDTAGKDPLLRALNYHPEIEVRLFNPFANREHRLRDFIGDTARVNHRMHNKTITADGVLTVFGGRNIGDEYFSAGEDVGFGDMDALAVGPVAAEIGAQFDLYWNSQWAYPVDSFTWDAPVSEQDYRDYRAKSAGYMEAARQSRYAEVVKQYNLGTQRLAEIDFVWSPWILAYDQPSKITAKTISETTHLAPRLKKALDATQSDLVIVSPYFVPGEWLTGYLTDMVERGVRVRILTNSLAANDVSLVHAGYMRYREDLLEGGVELFEYRADADAVANRQTGIRHIGASKASLHGKFFGFDKTHLFIGSFNLDGRSVALNTELGVYFASPTQAENLSSRFDEKITQIAYRLSLDEEGDIHWTTLDDGLEVSVDHEPDTSGWTRFKTRVLSWIVPEKQL